MAITVDWENKVISVPRADLLLIQSSPSEIRQLDVNEFRLTLKELEASEEGVSYLDTHYHNSQVLVSGAALAMVVVIINGYTVTFEDGQYRVLVVGANTNLGEVVNVNQVSVSTSNSAGLQDLNSLQAASFLGEVSMDVDSIYAGSIFPVGTRQYPVNNEADAFDICLQRGLKTIRIMRSMTVSGSWPDGTIFRGDNPTTIVVSIADSALVENCEFWEMRISGILDGGNTFRFCLLGDLYYTNGYIHQCALLGTISLGGGATAVITDSYSGNPSDDVGELPIINMGGSGNQLAVRSYSGGLRITNCTGDSKSSLDFLSGRLEFDSTVVDGEFIVRGILSYLLDNSVSPAVVHDQTISTTVSTTRKLLGNRAVISADGQTVTVYEDDGVTPFYVFDVSTDQRERTPQ